MRVLALALGLRGSVSAFPSVKFVRILLGVDFRLEGQRYLAAAEVLAKTLGVSPCFVYACRRIALLHKFILTGHGEVTVWHLAQIVRKRRRGVKLYSFGRSPQASIQFHFGSVWESRRSMMYN